MIDTKVMILFRSVALFLFISIIILFSQSRCSTTWIRMKTFFSIKITNASQLLIPIVLAKIWAKRVGLFWPIKHFYAHIFTSFNENWMKTLRKLITIFHTPFLWRLLKYNILKTKKFLWMDICYLKNWTTNKRDQNWRTCRLRRNKSRIIFGFLKDVWGKLINFLIVIIFIWDEITKPWELTRCTLRLFGLLWLDPLFSFVFVIS